MDGRCVSRNHLRVRGDDVLGVGCFRPAGREQPSSLLSSPVPRGPYIRAGGPRREFYVMRGCFSTGNACRASPRARRSWYARAAPRWACARRPSPGSTRRLALFLLRVRFGAGIPGRRRHHRASRPSRRIGVEWTNHYRPVSWASFDLDLSYTHVRFTDYSAFGRLHPGSPAFIRLAGWCWARRRMVRRRVLALPRCAAF